MGAEFLIIKLCLDCVIKFVLEPSSSMCVLRSVVKRAFDMLKVRWRIALKKVGQKTSILKKTMIAT